MTQSSKPTVAIIGASCDRHKYGNMSVRAHVRQGYRVFPINPHADSVEGLPAFASLNDLPLDRLDRVSVYVPADIGMTLLEDIAAKQPREVWFNPGSADAELIIEAGRLGLHVIQACSIADVSVSPGSLMSPRPR